MTEIDPVYKHVFHALPDIRKCTDGLEHDFKGWREFEDGRGGEQVCSKCGVGAMAYTLACDF